MKKASIIFPFLVFLLILTWALFNLSSNTPLVTQSPLPTAAPTEDTAASPRLSVVASGLEVPWALTFLPDGRLLITERAGVVKILEKNGTVKEVATIQGVLQDGESGLHGITLHPDFEKNKYIYLYYTYSANNNQSLNRVVRYTFTNDQLNQNRIIVDSIPGALNHDGGRIKFGPDNNLYITTGDAQEPSLAQEKNSLAGKILRVKDDGQPASGNPFNDRVYSYGHRNPQGITWDEEGTLWETEHGPSGVPGGNDELNKIIVGQNYGWPTIQGNQTREGMQAPVLNSGSSDTWAPAGIAYIDKSLYFGGLRGHALYEVELSESAPQLKEHFKEELGRIREVIVGPDGMLYITTSNRDGRGTPSSDDDRILRVNPQLL